MVEQTLPHLTPMIADMVRLQRFTGMRPGELVMMQPDEVDRSDEIWVYVPDHHKTEHHGKSRTIYLGPKAQAILAPWLLKCSTEYVFPTRRSQHYTSDSYRQVIHRACKLHGLTKWSPNQVRKATATSVRKALDVESAASLLGHSSSVVTQDHYATHDKQRNFSDKCERWAGD